MQYRAIQIADHQIAIPNTIRKNIIGLDKQAGSGFKSKQKKKSPNWSRSRLPLPLKSRTTPLKSIDNSSSEINRWRALRNQSTMTTTSSLVLLWRYQWRLLRSPLSTKQRRWSSSQRPFLFRHRSSLPLYSNNNNKAASSSHFFSNNEGAACSDSSLWRSNSQSWLISVAAFLLFWIRWSSSPQLNRARIYYALVNLLCTRLSHFLSSLTNTVS